MRRSSAAESNTSPSVVLLIQQALINLGIIVGVMQGLVWLSDRFKN